MAPHQLTAHGTASTAAVGSVGLWAGPGVGRVAEARPLPQASHGPHCAAAGPRTPLPFWSEERDSPPRQRPLLSLSSLHCPRACVTSALMRAKVRPKFIRPSRKLCGKSKPVVKITIPFPRRRMLRNWHLRRRRQSAHCGWLLQRRLRRRSCRAVPVPLLPLPVIHSLVHAYTVTACATGSPHMHMTPPNSVYVPVRIFRNVF
ncbi:PREDICTED: uncharacterized protein LOC106148019 [Chinchilla lanigera]|uniref:uncharacterized protein LOC106148019 n=1 Tax=Chinchilla lanigera TaxID=34839 RepID=UPI00069758A4|nr:PREDICTED: uncharacterized protein LOC106148019 [Chinchilla lanigera]